MIWDESVWEKPESQQLEGLCAVRSSKAKRLTHYKKGYYNPPQKPICVPGLKWIGLLLVGRNEQQGPPRLSAMGWWSSRGAQASFKRDEEAKLLLTCAVQWGRRVVHIFDQGFAGGLWQACCSLWACASSCAGVRSINSWMRKATSARPGTLLVANAARVNASSGIVGAAAGFRPVCWCYRFATLSSQMWPCRWWSVAARDDCPGIC